MLQDLIVTTNAYISTEKNTFIKQRIYSIFIGVLNLSYVSRDTAKTLEFIKEKTADKEVSSYVQSIKKIIEKTLKNPDVGNN